MSRFSERLKELRVSHGLSQQELANQLGCVSKSSVNMYERGEREPSFETLEAISDYFNVDMDYLLGKSDNPNRYRDLMAYLIEESKSGRPAAEDNMRRTFGMEHSTLSTYLCEDKSKSSILFYKAMERNAARELSKLIGMISNMDYQELENIRYLVGAYLKAGQPIRDIVDTALKPYRREEYDEDEE